MKILESIAGFLFDRPTGKMLIVTFDEKATAAIQEITARTGDKPCVIIQKGVALYGLAKQNEALGGKLISLYDDGREEELKP